jgi:hypothetical protein
MTSTNVDDFIGGAGEPPNQSKVDALLSEKVEQIEQEPLPWEAPGIREDVSKMFNVRLPEPYLLKLKFIAEHTPDSMQQFCLNVLLPAIDAKVSELTKQS